MVNLLLSWVTLSAGLWLTGALVPGFRVDGFRGALVVGAVYGVVHWFLGWLLFIVLGIGTLGLGFFLSFVTWWIVTAVLLSVTDALTDRLHIDRFRTALIASAVLSLFSVVRTAIFR